VQRLLLQVVTPEIHEYARYSCAINRRYAASHGYDYEVYAQVDPTRHPSWSKVKAAIERIATHGQVFILDADAYVQDESIGFEAFLYPKKSLNLCENGPNGGELLNTGAVVLARTRHTADLLRTWWDAGGMTRKTWQHFWEQDILNSLHNSGKDVPRDERFRDAVAVWPHHAFNSWWCDVERNPASKRFVQHIMARPLAEKAAMIRRHFDHLGLTKPEPL
jgi:hypothetical protein